MTRPLVFILALVCLLVSAEALADVIQVPADQPTIQAGIDASVSGDTVLVADGTYTGAGNRDMDFGGRGIVVKSASGAENCVIDCGGSSGAPHRAFYFHSGEGPHAVVEGFTMRNGYATDFGGAIYCLEGTPTIRSNLFTGNYAAGYPFFGGGAICLQDDCDALIINNRFIDNAVDTRAGAIYVRGCAPLIAGNQFIGNRGTGGGAVGGAIDLSGAWEETLIINNLFVDNETDYYGGAISCYAACDALIINNTMTRNSASRGGAVACDAHVEPVLINNIMWDNIAPTGQELSLQWDSHPTIDYSNVEGGLAGVYIASGCSIDWGAQMIEADPRFATGPDGDYYLGQVAAGQPMDSPCVDAGSDAAANICYSVDGGSICLDQFTTRTDQVLDAGIVDMGYHHGYAEASLPISARLSCAPSSGLLPFEVRLQVLLSNHHADYTRRLAGRIDLRLASGSLHFFWRDGFINLQPECREFYSWPVTFPARPAVLGENVFLLFAEDVTPPPFNQPPYPPSGDTATDTCTVTGEATLFN